MRYEDWEYEQSHQEESRKLEGFIPQRSSSPGKRTLTMSLLPRPAGAPVPLQRAAPKEVAHKEDASVTAQWLEIAMRPDLHSPPIQRKSTGRQPDEEPTALADGSGRPMPDDVQARMESALGADEREADEMGARAAASESAARHPGRLDKSACPTCGNASPGGQCSDCKAQPAQRGSVEQSASGGPQPQQGPACYPTNRTAGPQHEAIQRHYMSFIDTTGVREYAIPQGSGAGNRGYADLASMSTGAIYEIKPYFPAEIPAGLAQVAGYVRAAQQHCGSPPDWHAGTSFPDSVIPFGNKELVAHQYGHPGLILYYERLRKPEIDWKRVTDVVLALGLSVLLIPVIIAALLDPEPATKLALAGLSAVMITTILGAFGVEQGTAPQI